MTAYSTLFAFGDSLSDAGNLYFADGGTAPVSPLLRGPFQQRPNLGRGPFPDAFGAFGSAEAESRRRQ